MESSVGCTNPFSIVQSIGTLVSCVSGHHDDDEKDYFDDGKKVENGGVDGVDGDDDDGRLRCVGAIILNCDKGVDLKNVMMEMMMLVMLKMMMVMMMASSVVLVQFQDGARRTHRCVLQPTKGR